MASSSLSFVGNDLRRSTSLSLSLREMLNNNAASRDVFNVNDHHTHEEDEQNLKWAAIERLPTYNRMRKGVLRYMHDDGKVVHDEVDITRLGFHEKKLLMENILKAVEEDNEKFLLNLRHRINRVGIEIPKIEVRYENVSVKGDVHVGSRALPSLLNANLDIFESLMGLFHLTLSKKREIHILKDVSGIIKPSRLTLLLGPPSSGKTTLLLALAGKLDRNLRSSGRITYCGHELNEFVPQKTSAYISQHDLHHGQMTVRETLDFSGRCLGIGTRYEMLEELSRREKSSKIMPNPEIDTFMKAISVSGQETNLVTDYVLKILGLDICADIMVGDGMRRGISGGQKKRVTTGEMLVGPAKALFMDEISTGLDSSTTFQICKFMRQMVHILDVTMVISLLQPPPETFELFDDIILLSEGQIVYQGPRDNVLEFFESMGFKCPERKGVADFLQEVTSKKDQQQYWFRKDEPYVYVSVPEFVAAFDSFNIGEQIVNELRVPYDKSQTHPAALVKNKYGISNWKLLQACFSRELLLMKRDSFVYIFKTVQLSIMGIVCFTVFLRTQMRAESFDDGQKFYGAIFFTVVNAMFNGMAELPTIVLRLPVFYKQRDMMFFPAWAFGVPICILRIPLSLLDTGLWVCITYYTIGFAPPASRFFKQFLVLFCIHQMAMSLFRFIGAVDDIKPWLIWGYYASPLMYGQNAIIINEFLDDRWSKPNIDPRINEPTLGKALLKARGFYTEAYWYWIGIGAMIGFAFLFSLLFLAALSLLNPLGDTKTFISDEDDEKTRKSTARQNVIEGEEIVGSFDQEPRAGIVLPFQPLSLAFNHVSYYVDMPAAIAGVPKITNGYNPATWMLEISSPLNEAKLEVDFATIYANSALYQEKQQDLLNIFGGLYVVTAFLGFLNASGVQPVIEIERTVLYREKAAGMYSALPYAFSQVNANEEIDQDRIKSFM
ncbi:hypothetical protein RIF29_39777 [Crotalaria pallida]|uniref:ABC transporter domain-containing protein n=1 Tax=Crotalaria pallida TaxID=3830 RepID=A0AAN9E1V9_CROPI